MPTYPEAEALIEDLLDHGQEGDVLEGGVILTDMLMDAINSDDELWSNWVGESEMNTIGQMGVLRGIHVRKDYDLPYGVAYLYRQSMPVESWIFDSI